MDCKKIIFFFLLSTFLYSQEVEITATACSIISGLTVYNQIEDRNNFANGNAIYKDYSARWHKLQTLETVSLILVGVQIGLVNQDYIPGIITDVILTGAIRWIVRDGVYNLKLNESFWRQSKTTTASFEHLGTPLVKISFLCAVLFFKYFILPVL